MGRHRSPLKQALDVKSKLFALSRLVTLDLPALRRAASFFPERGLPEPARLRVLDRSVWPHPWLAPAYDAPRRLMLEENVDTFWPSHFAQPGATERFAAIVDDVVVPGHRVTPADPATGKLVASDHFDVRGWNWSRPSISALSRRTLSDDLTIVVPLMAHFGHLLTDVLLPHVFALQHAGLAPGARLNVVTSEKPVALIDAFAGALAHAGYRVERVHARVHETLRVPRLLYGACHTPNLEQKFATPESLAFARTHLLAAAGGWSGPRPKRVFLRRGRTRTRRVAGEAELIALLEREGFVALQGRWDNLAEQIATFEDLDVVVTVHGAGMANILWSRPRAALIEICARDARKTTGLHWASSVGANYNCILGSDEGDLQDFSIDPQAAFAQIMAVTETQAAR